MKFLLLFLLYARIDSSPINETAKLDMTKNKLEKSESKADTTHLNLSENELNGKSRAGVIDTLNPFNKESQTSSKDDGQNNNPLAAIQNFFSNAPQLFNGSNPFGQLFSTQPGGNFLDNVKLFFVGTQGMVMPASAILGGFQNLFQTLGNMGSFMQNLPNPLPTGQ